MTDKPLREEVELLLEYPCDMCHTDAMQYFIEQYNQWKDVFAYKPVVESYCTDEFQFIVKVTTPIYEEEGGEVEGESEYDYLGFIIVGPLECVEFLWIREDVRRQGHATKAVQLSEAKYYDFAIDDSQAFWDSLTLKQKVKKNENGLWEEIDEIKQLRESVYRDLFRGVNLEI